ncbi:cation channel sperm-associated auxiliary subunit epsilon [Psammomys obesus]|uniref:cation channel sperm-associated auxiliary subunit epsilon n=1 Tax=Psammomys obesus TaxID=48139 RepID=UPI0024528F1A|nr:cation channel sperm-associated auxiliary subunit epsilon [Psammomys obesus]
MSTREVAVLLWWLSGCVSAVWRYYINGTDYSIFSTRTAIELEYEGSTFISWDIPNVCTAEDTKSSRTKLHCSSSGIHRIKPNVKSPEDTRYLLVHDSYICFMWYYTVIDILDTLTQIITVWVFDPESASAEELLWTAKTPSLNSRILTKQLNTLGQQPYIYTIEKRKVYHPQPLTADGTWTIKLPMTSDDLLKVLKGNQVAFQDCFIANLPFLLTFPLLPLPEVPTGLSLTLPAGNQLMSTWGACIPSFAVLVTEKDTFQTNDSFRTWNRITVPPGILSDAQRQNVSGVTVFASGLIFLINGDLYYKSSKEFVKLGSSKGVPETEIIGMTRRKWCQMQYLFKSEVRKSMVAAWSKHELFLGYSSFRFRKVMDVSSLRGILKLGATQTIEIQKAEYTWHPLEIALILSLWSSHTTTKDINIVIYNEDSHEWTFQDYELKFPKDSKLFIHFLYSAMPDFVLWNEHSIYYCYKNFTVTGMIKTLTGDTNLSSIAHGSKIHNVIPDNQGSILVKMENNEMFYFKSDITDAVKLHKWLSKKAKTALYVNKSYNMYLLHFDNSKLTVREYPLYLEVQSIIHRNKDKDRCPFLAFQHNIMRHFYFLDKGESLTVWSQIVYRENLGLYIIVEHYGPNILNSKQHVNYEIASGFCTKTMLTTFSQSTDYESVSDYFNLQKNNMGLLLVQIRPSEFSKACPMTKKVFELAVGCDAKKHIRVKGYTRTECQRRDFSYVIDKEFLRERPSENLKIRYDVGRYGCPQRLEFNEPFHPVLELHDESGFVKIVEANFILWEIHGRNDYSFNNTMKQSGCINVAQTWKSMIEENPGKPLEDIWGPQNYRTCFSYAVGNPGDLNQPYEILNYSNRNHLQWPMDHSGMYVFRVKILDPNFSFCNLTAIFAIETFGVIPSPSVYLVASFLFVLMITFISILVLSYFWYMKIYRQFIFEPLHKPPGKQKKS